MGDFGGADRIAFTLVGDTVNTASRYEQARLCVDERPFGRVRLSPAMFSYIDVPELLVRLEPRPRHFFAKGGLLLDAHTSIE
jgi:class 3 adenylate cyclase